MSSNASNNGFPRGRGIFPLDPTLSPRGRGIIYIGQNFTSNGRGAFQHDQPQSSSNRGVFTQDPAQSPRGRGVFTQDPAQSPRGRGVFTQDPAQSPRGRGGYRRGRGFNTPVQNHASFNNAYEPVSHHQPFGRGGNQTNLRGFHSPRGHLTNTRGITATVQSHYSHPRGFQDTHDHQTSTRGFNSNHGYHVNSRGIGPSMPAGIQPIFGRGRGIPGNNDTYQQDNQRRNFGNYGRGNGSLANQENSPRRGKSKMNWSGSQDGRGIKTMAGTIGSKSSGGGTKSPPRGRLRNDRGGQPPGYNPNHKFYKTKFDPASIPEWTPSNLTQIQISSPEQLFCDKMKNKTQQSINIRQELERVINDHTNPRLSVLRIIVESRNNRGIVVDFEKWLKARKHQSHQYPSLTKEEKDLAVRAFLSEDKPTNLMSAINVFEIKSEEYKGVVPHLIKNGKYKHACDWATCLKLFDMFELSDFVMPLLVQGKLNTLEGYIDHSPRLGEQFVLFLDALSTDESLIAQYMSLSTRDGISQLKGKTLDKIIKRYASKFGMDISNLPNYCTRLETNDLIYWTREYNNIEPEAITAWRELMLSKLQRVPHLKSMFLDRLIRVDMEETKFWSKQLGIRTENIEFLFSSEMTLTEETEEENWLDGGEKSTKMSPVLWKENILASWSTWDNCDINQDSSNNNKYFTLPITGENLKFIDTVEDALDCFQYLSQASMIGLDGEFTTGPYKSHLSILQLSTIEKSFVLDMTCLSTKMTTEDWSKLTHLITHPDIMILGYGIQDDLVLLSKASPALEDIIQKKKNIVCLEKLKDQLFSLLSFPKSMFKGLSGTSESVLGKRLSKAEQISDWDRRPLRRAQLEYAALDAYIVLALYNKIQAVAEEKGKGENFRQIVNDFISGKSTKPKQNVQEKKDSESKAPVLGPLNKEPIKPKELHVVCDTMLQGVCKKLRVCGVDALALNNSQTHEHCLALRKEMLERTPGPVYILSRGKPAQLISKHLPKGHCYSLSSDLLDEQIKEIFQYFNVVADENDLFSRCVICNGDHYIKLASTHLKQIWKIEEKRNCIPAGAESKRRRSPAEKDQNIDVEGFMDSGQSSGEEDFNMISSSKIQERSWLEAEGGKVDLNSGEMENSVKIGVKNVPHNTLNTVEEFWICYSCGKVYWQGSHWEKAQDRVKDFLNVAPSPVPKPKS